MIKVYAIVSGVEYDLNYGDPAKFEGEDDLGMPPLHRLEERGPMQHGSTDRGYRLDPRFPTYVFGIPAWSPAELRTKRRQLLQIFRPSRLIIMKHVLEDGEIRYLDGYYYGGMKMPAQDRRAGVFQKTAIILKTDDPTFYDPEGVSVSFALGGGGSAWEFPWVIPWTVGASSIDLTQNLEYAGDVATFPTIIRITGPITSAIITNMATGEKLDFTGTTIAAGDYYDIDLRYGLKTIVDSTGADQFSDLTTDSDHSTWHIAADDEVADGINPIRVQGSAITAATKIEINYFNRSSGI
jgi:hypothetical protein